MLRAKISVAIKAFSMEMRRAIDQAMELGAQGIQVDLRTDLLADHYGASARRQLLHVLSERNLQLASGHFPLRNPIAAKEHLGPRLAALESAITFASKLKIRTLTLRAGRIPDAEQDDDGFRALQSIISDLAAQGNRQGVTLCLLPCGESAVQIRQFIESIKSGPVMVDADLSSWVMNRQSVVTQLRELHDLIGHVEIRDAIRDVDGRGREVPVGEGEIDWNEVVALLNEMSYTGWLNVDRYEGTDRRGDISRGVSYLKKRLPIA